MLGRRNIEAGLQLGDSFPDFELEVHTGGTVSLADLKGRPFIIFCYPKALTPG